MDEQKKLTALKKLLNLTVPGHILTGTGLIWIIFHLFSIKRLNFQFFPTVLNLPRHDFSIFLQILLFTSQRGTSQVSEPSFYVVL